MAGKRTYLPEACEGFMSTPLRRAGAVLLTIGASATIGFLSFTGFYAILPVLGLAQPL